MINNILLVDDDKEVLNMLYKVMESNGLPSDMVDNGQAALDALTKKEYSLMILDINMKGLDGFEVIKRLRDKGNMLPIVVVSARKDDYDALYGLNIGADDYITKPFNPITLGAKVKAILRRTNSLNETIKAGPFVYDLKSLRFYKNDQEIVLTGKETIIMRLFMDNVGRIFSKDTLYELVWENDIVDDNIIMVYMNRLRQKIEDNPSQPKYIQNVRGLGYRFVI